MLRCTGCRQQLSVKRSRWSNGLAYCLKCMKQRTKRIAQRTTPGAIQKGSKMAGKIVAVPPSVKLIAANQN
jgi:hypothetical protein